MTPYNPIAWGLESFQVANISTLGDDTSPLPPAPTNSMGTQAPALRTLPAGYSYYPLPVILVHQSLTDPLEFQLFKGKNLLLDFLCGVFPVFPSLSLLCFVPCMPRKSCFFFFFFFDQMPSGQNLGLDVCITSHSSYFSLSSAF